MRNCNCCSFHWTKYRLSEIIDLHSFKLFVSYWNCKLSAMALWAPSSSHKLFLASLSARHGNGRRRNRNSRRDLDSVVHVGMADAEAVAIAYEEGERERPKWAEQTPFSLLVQALVSFKPLYSVLKLGARQVLIRFLLFFLWHIAAF